MSFIDLRKPHDKDKKVAKADADIIVILSVERPTCPICDRISDNFILLEGNKTLAICFISFDELKGILLKICEDNIDNFQVSLMNALYRKFLAEVYIEKFDYIDLYNIKKYFEFLLYNLHHVECAELWEWI